jgi:hypothetical protein
MTAICLDLHLGETMLPDSHIGSDTILTVVHEENPIYGQQSSYLGRRQHSHSIRVHRLADVEIIVLEVAHNLLGKRGGALLECGDLLIGSSLRLQCLLDLLHVRFTLSDNH